MFRHFHIAAGFLAVAAAFANKADSMGEIEVRTASEGRETLMFGYGHIASVLFTATAPIVPALTAPKATDMLPISARFRGNLGISAHANFRRVLVLFGGVGARLLDGLRPPIVMTA